MEDHHDKSAANARDSALKPVVLLCLVTLAAQFASLAFGRIDQSQPLASMALPSLVFLAVLTLPACWLGVVLGRRVGLGLVPRALPASGGPRNPTRDIAVAALAGLLLGALLLALRVLSQPYLPPEVPAAGFRGVTGGLAVSVGAAVAEEVWFRLGLLTLLVWAAMRVLGRRARPAAVMWTMITLTALGFGLAHLPQLMSYGVSAPFALGTTALGNTLVGLLYGWCYWRMGLAAAIAAHFAVDLVLHVLTAIPA